MMQDVEQNLAAQKLINRAEAEKYQGLYYMQVPIRFRDEDTTAEVRLEFQRNHRGDPVVDAQNLRVEFAVYTQWLGQVSYVLTVVNGKVDLLTSSEDDVTRECSMELSLAPSDPPPGSPGLHHERGPLQDGGRRADPHHPHRAEAEF